MSEPIIPIPTTGKIKVKIRDLSIVKEVILAIGEGVIFAIKFIPMIIILSLVIVILCHIANLSQLYITIVANIAVPIVIIGLLIWNFKPVFSIGWYPYPSFQFHFIPSIMLKVYSYKPHKHFWCSIVFEWLMFYCEIGVEK